MLYVVYWVNLISTILVKSAPKRISKLNYLQTSEQQEIVFMGSKYFFHSSPPMNAFAFGFIESRPNAVSIIQSDEILHVTYFVGYLATHHVCFELFLLFP